MFLQVDILRMIAEFIGTVFTFSRTVLTPFGEVMKLWVEAVLSFWSGLVPMEVNIYIILFIVLVISGVIINYHWPGDKKNVDKKEKKQLETSVAECKYCGKPIGDSEFCPYCGSRN